LPNKLERPALAPHWRRWAFTTRSRIFPGENAIPLVMRPEDFVIIVAGGPGRHSCWMPTFGRTTLSVTKAIAHKDGTPAKSIREFMK
jgi:hypothetical protein